MTIWLVRLGVHYDWDVVAAFDTKAAAESYCVEILAMTPPNRIEMREPRIQEMVLNQPSPEALD
jgi:hypothetical protein